MGLGGALLWTGLARNLRRAHPKRPVVLVHRRSWRDKFRRAPNPDVEVYDANPDIALVVDEKTYGLIRPLIWPFRPFVMDQRLSAKLFVEAESPERLTYPRGRHFVEILCDAYGVPCADKRPYLVLRPEEAARADGEIAEAGLEGREYLCFVPHSKQSFTPNKAWFRERWEAVVETLRRTFEAQGRDVAFVQLGVATDAVLPGMVDLTGRLGFRENARVLERSLGLVSYMGGLVHLSKAVGRRNVVLISGFEPREIASYDDDENLYAELDCSGCGYVVPCPRDRECMRRIGVDEVVEACLRLVGTGQDPGAVVGNRRPENENQGERG